MYSLLVNLSLFALTLPIHALHVPTHHVVHERRDVTSKKWIKRGHPESSSILPMRIGLAQSSLDDAHGYLMDVSSPASPNYGKHWTSKQVNEAFEPSDATIRTVKQWLEESGISSSRISQSANKAWLNLGVSVKEAEKLLYTKYHIFEHKMKGDLTVACDEYHVPGHIHDHVDFITPGIHVGHLKMLPTGNG